jgi:lysozyme
VRLSLALFVVAVACTDARTGEVIEEVQQCPTQTIEGVDVYQGTGTVDWAKVKAAGRAFAFIKATQGDYNKQSTFAADWAGAKAAGVVRSPYHFFDATKDGAAQAAWFLAEVNAAGGIVAGDLPAMLDIECPTSRVQANAQSSCEYTGNSGWAPTATIVQRVFDWLQAVEQATGRAPIIYSYPSWFGDVGVTDARLAAYPLFIASYASCASVPSPWTQAVFWQYSASGSVAGISGAVDEDRFVGSAGDLGALTATPPDAGVTPGPDAGSPPLHHAGCGCNTDGGFGGIGLGLGLGLVLVLARTRRRVRARSRSRQ